MKKSRPKQTAEQIRAQTHWGFVLGMSLMVNCFVFTIMKMSASSNGVLPTILLACSIIGALAAIQMWRLR